MMLVNPLSETFHFMVVTVATLNTHAGQVRIAIEQSFQPLFRQLIANGLP
jgi:hypothetical protein